MRGLPKATLLALTLSLATSVGGKEGPRIVVDAGHGGNQEGALGPNGLKEKTLCLAIANKLKAMLEKKLNAQVTLTREDDALLPLPMRVDIANRSKPDVFISIHANSMPTRKLRARAEGIETYFLSANASGEDARKTADRENAEAPVAAQRTGKDMLAFILSDLERADLHSDSSRLAYAIHQKLIAETGAEDRGVQQAPFYVLTGVEAPSVLVEVGFVSHPQEGPRLGNVEYQSKVAAAITSGVEAFFHEVELKGVRSDAAASAAHR